MSPTLTDSEKSSIRSQIPSTCSPLSLFTIARLYLFSPPSISSTSSFSCSDGWIDSGLWGACVLIIDRTPPKGNFLKLFSLKAPYSLLFSYELYEHMHYQIADPLFHIFELDASFNHHPHNNKDKDNNHGSSNYLFAALSFADSAEAKEFSDKVKNNIPKPDIQKTEKKSFFSRLFSSSSSNNNNNKGGVGLPTNVQHVSHIGFDSDKGVFNMADIPSEWKTIMKNAGVKKSDLQNPETASFIYETLQKYKDAPTELVIAAAEAGGARTTTGSVGGGVPIAPSHYINPSEENNRLTAPSSSSLPSPPSPLTPPEIPIAPAAPTAPEPPSAPAAPSAPSAPSAPDSEPGSSIEPPPSSSSSSTAAPSGDLLSGLSNVKLKKAENRPPITKSPLKGGEGGSGGEGGGQSNSDALSALLSKAMANRFNKMNQKGNKNDDDDEWD